MIQHMLSLLNFPNLPPPDDEDEDDDEVEVDEVEDDVADDWSLMTGIGVGGDDPPYSKQYNAKSIQCNVMQLNSEGFFKLLHIEKKF